MPSSLSLWSTTKTKYRVAVTEVSARIGASCPPCELTVMSVDDPQVLVALFLLLAILCQSEAWWQLQKVAQRVPSSGNEVEDALEVGSAT